MAQSVVRGGPWRVARPPIPGHGRCQTGPRAAVSAYNYLKYKQNQENCGNLILGMDSAETCPYIVDLGRRSRIVAGP
jgi:hypothetical protein